MRTPLTAALILAGSLLMVSTAHGQSPLPDVRPEAVINTFTTGDQTAPAVAASASGTVWITWLEQGEPPYGLKARRFDGSGAPLGPEIWVSKGGLTPFLSSSGPRIGATADGGSVVAWAESPSVWFRRFDRDGAPLGDAQRMTPSSSFGTISFPEVAVAADGSFIVAWLLSDLLNDTLQFQRFDSQGQSSGGLQVIASTPRNMLATLRVAGAADGGFLAVWQNAQEGTILARRYDATGTGPAAARVDDPSTGYAVDPAAALASDGSARLFWIAGTSVWARRLTAKGETASPGVKVADGAVNFLPLAAASDKDGNVLAVWSRGDLTLQGRLLKDDLTPLSGVFPAADPSFLGTNPALAATAGGNLTLAWSSGYDFHPPFLPPPPVAGRDGSAQGIAARTFAPTHCAAGSGVLCLGPGSRFEARVAWKNPFNGDTGTGHTLPLTADTGAFWFFGDQNLELMVKVLDGSEVNRHFWIYGGSLSNVEYTLTVTDTLIGSERNYHNPAGVFASLADVEAFFSPVIDPPGASAPAALPAAPAPVVGCLPVAADPTSLCLASGHFTVSAQFTDPRTGLAGAATAVPLTGDTGAFWFFDDANLELMVKVLDGRGVNGKFWVFFGALSDVDYTITVTRPETGEVKTYHNPRGTLASRADIQAF
ncbi:MAG TPA: hypothetical protein VF173_32600 [Thermoanaerobaculia bacterium]|nr:hypothetical protein [Thermoanaerobaculia bacterium]